MTNTSLKIISNKMEYKKENINSILTINVANLIKNYNKLKSLNSKIELT